MLSLTGNVAMGLESPNHSRCEPRRMKRACFLFRNCRIAVERTLVRNPNAQHINSRRGEIEFVLAWLICTEISSLFAVA